MDSETDNLPAVAQDGAELLCAWLLADGDTQATAYRSVCRFLRDIRSRPGAASFLVDEVAPRAVRALAQEGQPAKAAELLAFLSSFRPDRCSTALRFSHARQLAQLHQDITNYLTH